MSHIIQLYNQTTQQDLPYHLVYPVLKLAYKWALRIYSIDSFKREFLPLTGVDVTSSKLFRNALDQSSYVNERFKAWLFWCVIHGIRRTDSMWFAANDFLIQQVDMPMGSVLLDDPDFLSGFYSPPKPLINYKAYTYQDLILLRDNIISSSDLRRYISKELLKVSFITSNPSSNYTRDDMMQECLFYAVKAFRTGYPRFRSDLHALNHSKTSITNMLKNKQLEFSRDKKQILIQHEDGSFETLVIGYDNTNDSAFEASYDGLDDVQLDLMFDFIMDNLQNHPKWVRIITEAVMGRPSEELSNQFQQLTGMPILSARYNYPDMFEDTICKILNISKKDLNQTKQLLYYLTFEQ